MNAASGEELSRIAAGAPLFAVSAAEVYPLSGIDSITAYADAMRRTVGVPA